MNVEITVRVDDRGRLKPSRQFLKYYYFRDFLIKDDYLYISFKKHVRATSYSLDIRYT